MKRGMINGYKTKTKADYNFQDYAPLLSPPGAESEPPSWSALCGPPGCVGERSGTSSRTLSSGPLAECSECHTQI